MSTRYVVGIAATLVLCAVIVAMFARPSSSDGNRLEPVLTESPDPAPPPSVVESEPVAPEPAYVSGNPDAPIVVEEYSDYLCPFCARQHREHGADLSAWVAADPDVQYHYYDVILPHHVAGLPVSVAARCAGEQGLYAQAKEVLFEMHDEWHRSAQYLEAAMSVRELTDAQAFDACMESSAESVAARANANLQQAFELGIRGTPGFVIHRDGEYEAFTGLSSVQRVQAELGRLRGE